ncbi:hypothetical protein A3H80_04575 [Candidatus Roizmanbacteria bacterium RIFCSPLOWO2_02_FULL_37_19]|uniref:Glycosyl transferase family 1 domain-containing protein n=1 Tax=Candidatus Roizmanbacteria bacterium RIFCSPHIGHO2_02_FULL_37_24 TaxID=1802037 RepID=A0A1F7GW64_9BACT|nr:MAG: hypothetical protein A2862_01690 [Candidatus Roizmanbacteria bacterium RIFCSPHIGHO2_01_FULL_38_41]OGK22826.1 MAG: hypothetical protein A3C24_04380 [Candidatus Roizmanbacteria bacterium RIFCSPHIGHO2_02_FULL_37_24]OGK33810.1 MAG: hypothetical protein A3E10_02775 [Candidatus Roizmanbacteria bacterium RIFCSPHIGHO2_12_FULL_37_23]OGK43759.1 MAG: hypothetical protein A2956_00560 [Candidatus Roizmanbacteria bacterium RIFCSPLOWO2_01_FULL_37_57]OGK54867.1 MAG: hypothetical protein A3H80_04575 [Ca
MKIGIDLSMLVYAGSGVATYTFNLAKSLLKYGPDHEYRFFYSSFRRPLNFYYLKELQRSGARITELKLPASTVRFLWNSHHIFPIEWFMGKVDVFHSSDYLRPPLLRRTKGITTIHDLTWKLFPHYHTPNVISHHERKLARTIRYKDTIIVDSQNTKRDLLNCYPRVDENRIHVIYLGIDERYNPVTDKRKIKDVLTKYSIPFGPAQGGLNTQYLLYVGAIEPRKNLDTAIQVFAQLIKDPDYQDYLFLIAGRAGWKNEHIFSLIKKLGLEKKVIFIGFVKDHDLPALYSGASSLVYLSLYEGFGLPPLEAARCGTPSLIYRNSSLAETFPKNYPFAHEGRELEILKTILSKPEHINLSFVSKFTWQAYCEKFLHVLEQ